jgi:protein-disulfide isomerase
MSKSGRAAARERIRLERERAARRRQRNRVLIVVGSAGGAIVIAVVVILVVRPGQNTGTSTGPVHSAYYNGPFAPVTKNPDHSVTSAQPGVKTPVLDVYEDFQCPVCDAFEKANGASVQKLARQGKVRVIYHPFTIFLGEQPAQCVPAGSWLRYHNLLYSNQPGERTKNGFPVSLLLALGAKIGLTSASFTHCVSAQTYAPQAVPFSEQVIKGGIDSTPTVKLNGRAVSLETLEQPGTALQKLILAAR